MGVGYDYRCRDCRYEVEVNGLGIQRGLLCTIESCLCPHCQIVTDVVRAVHPQEGWPSVSELEREKDLCGECMKPDVVPWEDPFPCPKCGAGMEEASEQLDGNGGVVVRIRCWD